MYEVVAAVVAGVFALLTAVFAEVTRRRTVEVESKLKQQDEVLRRYFDLALESRGSTLRAFVEVLRAVQLLRDTIRQIANYPEAFPPAAGSEDVEALVNAVREAYASNMLYFEESGPKGERAMIHRLKGKCSEALAVLRIQVAKEGRMETDQLLELEVELAALQTEIRDRAYTRLAQNTMLDGVNSAVGKEDPKR